MPENIQLIDDKETMDAILLQIDEIKLDENEPLMDMGNSIIMKSSWSSIETESNNPGTLSRMTSITSNRSQIDRFSYKNLLINHANKFGSFANTVDLKDVWDRFENSLGVGDENGIIGYRSDDHQNEQFTVNKLILH